MVSLIGGVFLLVVFMIVFFVCLARETGIQEAAITFSIALFISSFCFAVSYLIASGLEDIGAI